MATAITCLICNLLINEEAVAFSDGYTSFLASTDLWHHVDCLKREVGITCYNHLPQCLICLKKFSMKTERIEFRTPNEPGHKWASLCRPCWKRSGGELWVGDSCQ